MNLKEAEEIIELHKHLEKPIQDPIFQTELKLAIYRYQMAKGFIEGWNQAKENAEILVRALEKSKRLSMGPSKECSDDIFVSVLDALREYKFKMGLTERREEEK